MAGLIWQLPHFDHVTNILLLLTGNDGASSPGRYDVIGCKLKQNANEGCNSCASLAGLVLSFIACLFYLWSLLKSFQCGSGNINTGKFWGDQRWGREKVACWRTKAAISLKRVKREEKLLWTAYRNSPTLCRMVPSRTPTDFPSPKLGLATPTQNCNLKFRANECW